MVSTRIPFFRSIGGKITLILVFVVLLSIGVLDEVAAASSKEQSLAIDQITEGLIRVDQVTQSNTAIAEESASAAEQPRGAIGTFKLTGSTGVERLQALVAEDVL